VLSACASGANAPVALRAPFLKYKIYKIKYKINCKINDDQWRYTHRAILRTGSLCGHFLLRLDPVLFAETKIARLDQNESGRSMMPWQHRVEYSRSNGITSPRFLERDFREELANGFHARTLPLRPYQTQRQESNQGAC
jgi:hypothetical protein